LARICEEFKQNPELNWIRSFRLSIQKDPARLSQGMTRIETRISFKIYEAKLSVD
jgi:hypothetical protein